MRRRGEATPARLARVSSRNLAPRRDWGGARMLWLLLLAPAAVILDHIEGVPAPLIFFCAAIAIVPLAKLIVDGTEGIAHYTGPAIGGLLNATFGNLPELIICLVALRSGLVEMVRASLVGALLANLLLGLGLAFFLGEIGRAHV